MEPDELEQVLSRAAQLFDKHNKTELIELLENDLGRVPLDACPSIVYQGRISKGALVAEVIYREFTGQVKNRPSWHQDSRS